MDITERESDANIQRVAPLIRQARSLEQQGKGDEAFQTLRSLFEAGEMLTYFCQPAGWVIYHYLKSHLHQLLPGQAIAMFRYYLDFCEHKPNMLHSLIMVMAVSYKKLHSQEFPFLRFCKSWGLDSFRDEDFQSPEGAENNGKHIVFQSLAVRAATFLYKDMKQRREPDTARQLLPFFETVLQRCPEYEFTPLYIANIHAWCGDRDQAIDMFKVMLVSNQQWYLWKSLGDLLDDRLKIACYCKALTMNADEKYVVEIHLSLASMLHSTDLQQAAYELKAYTSTCQRNGWRLRSSAYELASALKNASANVDANTFYQNHAAEAEGYAFADQPSDEFIYRGTVLNKQGKQRAQLVNQAKRIFINTKVTPQLRNASPGEAFTCKYHLDGKRPILLTAKSTGKVVAANAGSNDGKHAGYSRQRATGNGSNESKNVEGQVRKKEGQAFAFVDNCFVPPRLCQSAGLLNGQQVRARAVQQPDGRWRVVKIY